VRDTLIVLDDLTAHGVGKGTRDASRVVPLHPAALVATEDGAEPFDDGGDEGALPAEEAVHLAGARAVRLVRAGRVPAQGELLLVRNQPVGRSPGVDMLRGVVPDIGGVIGPEGKLGNRG
jgi:hypothetical protein